MLRISYRQRKRVGRNFLVFTIRPDTTDIFWWRPSWKTQLINDVQALRGGQVLDVGANIGQTLLDYCAGTTRNGYLGFEPIPRCADYLNTLIDSNKLSDCSVVPAALSNRNTIIKLYLQQQFPTDSAATLLGELRPDRSLITQLIPCYRFDDIRNDIGTTSRAFGLIKIDVEGAELHVIEGMERTIRSDRPWILCEVLDRDSAADAALHQQRCAALYQQMDILGYDIMRIQKSSEGDAILNLLPIKRFPNRVWTESNSNECDYLFIPSDERTLAADRFTLTRNDSLG
jgi:FkbM family methyltransferase